MNLVIQNTALAEIQGGASASPGMQFNFPDIEYLRGQLITGIVCHVGGNDYSYRTSVNPVVTYGILQACTLTLVTQDSNQPVLQFPPINLSPISMGGIINQFGKLNLILPKCYVTLNDATSWVSNSVFAFSFLY